MHLTWWGRFASAYTLLLPIWEDIEPKIGRDPIKIKNKKFGRDRCHNSYIDFFFFFFFEESYL